MCCLLLWISQNHTLANGNDKIEEKTNKQQQTEFEMNSMDLWMQNKQQWKEEEKNE